MPKRKILSDGFGEFLYKVRKSRGWNQEQIGHKLTITKFQVSHLETSTRGPSIEVLTLLVAFLSLEEVNSLADIIWRRVCNGLPPVLILALRNRIGLAADSALCKAERLYKFYKEFDQN